MQTDSSNELFFQADRLVNHTSRNIFLTGKAGTGKTTFLRHIKENCAKNMAVVAPTGVAAINAGGVTIHSFFQLPFGPFYPGERLELVLRTLMPIFSCYTVAQGEILIQGQFKPEGGTKTWVECQ